MDLRLERHQNCTGLCSGPQYPVEVQGLAWEEQG